MGSRGGAALQQTAHGVMLVPDRTPQRTARRVLVPPKPKTVPPPPPPPPSSSSSRTTKGKAPSKSATSKAKQAKPAAHANAAAGPPPGMVAVPGRAREAVLPAGATGASSLLVPQYGAARGTLIVPAGIARGAGHRAPAPQPKAKAVPPPQPQAKVKARAEEPVQKQQPQQRKIEKPRTQVLDVGMLRTTGAGKRARATPTVAAGTARYGEGTGKLVMPPATAPPAAKKARAHHVVGDSDEDEEEDDRLRTHHTSSSGPYYDDDEDEDEEEEEDDDMDGFVVDDDEEDGSVRQDVAREVQRLAWGNANRLARHRAAERRARMLDREDGGNMAEVRGREALDREEAATRRRARTLERLQDLQEQGIDVAKYLRKLNAASGKKKVQGSSSRK